MESHPSPLSLFRLPHTVIFSSHLVYPTQPSIHWVKNIFLDSFLFLTSPTEPISCQYQLLYISQILLSSHVHCHHCSCTFVSSLLCLALLSLPATTSHTVNTSLMWSCPFLRGFMAIICLQEKVQTKALRTCGSLLSVQPVSCLSSHPHTYYLSLSSYLQFCSSPSLSLQFFEHAVLTACVSHCLLISSSDLALWPL